MKTLNLFKFILLGFLITSCSDSNEPTGSGSGSDNEAVTSITLSTASNTVNTSAQVAFIVTGNNSTDLTSLSSLKVDNLSVSNPFSFNLEGTYQVVATYEDLTSNTLTITVTDIPPTSIELSFDQDNYNNGDSAIFVVTDNFNNTVTTEAEVTVNGTVTTANPYPFTADGTYNFEATYEGLTSNTITINVVSASSPSDTSSFTASGAPTTFTKKALLEDFTGTWCPQCPPAGSAIANAMSGNSNIFGVGYHAGGGGSEPMTIPETAFWSGYYNVTGFPTVYVNGPDTRWNYNSMSQVNTELAETATVGLAVDAALVGGKLDLEVKVGFNTAANEAVRLMIYLLEDNVTTSTAQAGSSQGANYVHRDVLREVYTDQLGDAIDASNTMAGGVLTRTLTGLDLPSNVDDVANLKVIAFVRNTYTKTFVDYFDETHTDSPHYDIYNVQEVHVGETQAFD
ncbi:hypothetical protein FORMB_26150 [Formosa sp. Hel1_33_131]|uniref:Omp28-related outer membrane protein n=1 Tax=Formosa sp. Hel1_33_131 TaxID=1336794 RepID=UPI00084E32F2|nr:Omp28-related outer membrane protein [Formosa sp. Hel1_33_131]AOR29631.1 hypothetical protein FORMB_26150 [Formosa sp. Hel1_33_131]